ncbi:O-methyltransferase [Jonesia quinghaiensis]|uniref:O-methyltransferase n=1 Tax=Jonesia quinghaiensis TaxID=262806 RepID=UPI0003F86878|nr:class I SAM-dependent methyltransferase [Jonesia quinghaiensis]
MSHMAANWAFAEQYVNEPSAVTAARERAFELGCPVIGASTGGALRLLAAATQAKTAVEVGTGTAVASLWLLYGMPTDGVLTTIDPEREHHRAAKTAFHHAEISSHRTRAITGHPHDVLPRLADNAYDLFVLSSGALGAIEVCHEAYRLLRPGGVAVFTHAFVSGRLSDPANRDENTVSLRQWYRDLGDSPQWTPSILPVGDGLLCLVRGN